MVYDNNGTKKEVPHYCIDEAHNIVGVMIAPDDNNKNQVVKMRQLALKFGDQVQVGFIRGHDIFHALNITVMRSLNWPLPAITLTKQECTHIMAPIIKNVLAKLKNTSIIKRKVMYGLVAFQGMGLKNLYTLLGERY